MTPSDALARLAGIVHRAQSDVDRSRIYGDWLVEIERSASLFEPLQEWQLEAEDLFRTEALVDISWPRDEPADAAQFARLIKAVQALDRWHRPLVPSSDGRSYPMLRSHEEAATVMRDTLRFGGDDQGSIIPAVVWRKDRAALAAAHEIRFTQAHPKAAARTTPGVPDPGKLLLPQILGETAYLPKTVEAQNPDAGGRLEDRMVAVVYKRPNALRPVPVKPVEMVAIIPLLESKDDLSLELSPDRLSYGVRPLYPLSRLEEAVRRAVEGGAELILFPETTVRETDLDALKRTVREIAKADSLRRKDATCLRYVWVGVAGEPETKGGRDRNFAILLDSLGDELARQHKMFRWDISAAQLARFGLHTALRIDLPKDPDWRLKENIEIASELQLIDLADIGRTFTMICADIDYNLPGDWISDQFHIDWLHAPIMDQFLDKIVAGRTPMKGTWICERAHRAAYGGRGLIMVTNSMALTGWLNEENERLKTGYAKIDPCGIGILIDANATKPTYCHIQAPFDPTSSPIVEFQTWNRGWSALG